MEDLTGKQLGQYRIVAPLGEGGMAAVYKAYQASVERYVALKILPRHYASDPDFVRRFKREAKVIAGLSHPNILPVHDYGEAEGYTYIVMRYVEGGTLADSLQGKPLPLSKICHIISQVAAALDYAHAKGVIHRDVKPSNVLLDEQGNCLLSDFGIARMIEATGQFTTAGAFIGTPTYASPEQALGQNLDGRSDVYSLGVVLYEMVTGRPPFDAETPMAILIKHVHDPLPIPRAINPAVSEGVERVILKALAKEPESRYQTAGEAARALAAAATAGVATPVRVIPQTLAMPPEPEPPPVVSARPRPRRGRRIPVWGWVAGGLIVLCLIAGLLGGGGALVPYLMRGTAAATSVSAARPTTATVPGATLPAILTAALATTVAPGATAIPGTPSPTGLSTETPVSQGTPMPVQGYALPLAEPWDVVYDGSGLWVLYQYRLVKLELVEAEGRFRAAEQVLDFSAANSLAWDPSREAYWAVRGAPWWVGEEIDLVDQAGNRTATFTVPQTFVGYPRFLTWDGEYLWVTSDAGSLYKLQPVGDGGELMVIDSYGLGEASELTWDGNHLWLLGGGALSKLNQVMQPICRINRSAYSLPDCRGLTWDGQFLWCASMGANMVYRIDPASCQ
jgi:hypothetical protein